MPPESSTAAARTPGATASATRPASQAPAAPSAWVARGAVSWRLTGFLRHALLLCAAGLVAAPHIAAEEPNPAPTTIERSVRILELEAEIDRMEEAVIEIIREPRDENAPGGANAELRDLAAQLVSAREELEALRRQIALEPAARPE